MNRIHIAMRHEDDAIIHAGTDFLAVLRNEKAIEHKCFYVMEGWLSLGVDRKAAMLQAVNAIYTQNQYEPGQRVDLAVEALRGLGCLCPWYTSRLLSESLYGSLPAGSVAALTIAIGQNDH